MSRLRLARQRSRLHARLARTPPGYELSIGRVLAIYGGLVGALLLAGIDQTVVSTALPRIVADLGDLTQFAWVFTSYMVASTVSIPLYGKLGDVYGRRRMLLVAVAVLLVGSILCGLARDMTELVIFRVIQGFGGGGIIPLVMAVTGDVVPARDRARYHGLLSATFIFASFGGPTIGGAITDAASWRWIFFLNAPAAVVAILLIRAAVPPRRTSGAPTVDWAGAALLGAATSVALLALVMGGSVYPWGSAAVGAAAAAAVATFAAFVVFERKVRDPILPVEALRIPAVAATMVCMALAGAALFGVSIYAPLFAQGVLGTSATSSGVILTPLLLTAPVASLFTGFWTSRTGKTRPAMLLGSLLVTAGMLLLSRMDESTTAVEVARNLAITGTGIGLMMQLFVLTVQDRAPRSELGAATALTQFARGLGGATGVAVMGAIIGLGLPGSRHSPGDYEFTEESRADLASALQPAFLAGACGAAVLFLMVAFVIDQKPLSRQLEGDQGPG